MILSSLLFSVLHTTRTITHQAIESQSAACGYAVCGKLPLDEWPMSESWVHTWVISLPCDLSWWMVYLSMTPGQTLLRTLYIHSQWTPGERLTAFLLFLFLFHMGISHAQLDANKWRFTAGIFLYYLYNRNLANMSAISLTNPLFIFLNWVRNCTLYTR